MIVSDQANIHDPRDVTREVKVGEVGGPSDLNSLDEASRIVNFYLQGSAAVAAAAATAAVVRLRVDDGFLDTEEPREFPNNCGALY